MIVQSLMSLFWLFWLLMFILYITSLILTQGATNYRVAGSGAEDDEVVEMYGSLFKTMYSLFKAMSGGVSWGEIAEPMKRVHWLFFGAILLYMFFTLFSVLNIVTGVFVDEAIQAAQRDRTVLVEKQKKFHAATTQTLLALLEDIDTDNTGVITMEEMNVALETEHIRKTFEALGIDIDEVSQLLSMLDADGDGVLDIAEFVDGIQKLKIEAKSWDVHILMMQSRQILKTTLDYLEHHGWVATDAPSMMDHSVLTERLQVAQVQVPDGTGGTAWSASVGGGGSGAASSSQ